MLLSIVIALMVSMGILGGSVNYILPANTDPATGKKVRNQFNCMILGIGATILVPLFLEFAQSKLLDDINSKTDPKIKDYFLYGSYCFLAAAAGFRFINSLMESVLKDKTIVELKKQKEKIEKKSETLEKEITKIDAHTKLRMEQEESEAVSVAPGLVKNFARTISTKAIRPVIHNNDPQKERFGGKPEVNNRRLSASVAISDIPDFYNVKIMVESTNPKDHPLNTAVILYLHDSFSPSVLSIATDQFIEGKAIYALPAYGAFTVGAVTDQGHTLLELDLSLDQSFPKDFRDR